MADLPDVENAIVTLIAGAIYPNGSGNPSAALNDAGNPLPVRIFRGWPVSEALDADLIRGTANVSVFSRGLGRNTTRYAPEYEVISQPSPTVTATVAGNEITIAGAGSAAITQYVSVNVGGRIGVSYGVGAADTAAVIAAALAASLVAAGISASAAGAVITVNSGAALYAVAGVAVGELAEIRRQTEQMQITLWCPTPKTRDTLAAAIEPVLASTFFLTLADTSAARFRYVNTMVSDLRETVQCYRRDFLYAAEYATTLADTAWQVTLPQVAGAVSTVAPPPAAPSAAAFNAEPTAP